MWKVAFIVFFVCNVHFCIALQCYFSDSEQYSYCSIPVQQFEISDVFTDEQKSASDVSNNLLTNIGIEEKSSSYCILASAEQNSDKNAKTITFRDCVPNTITCENLEHYIIEEGLIMKSCQICFQNLCNGSSALNLSIAFTALLILFMSFY
uniref:Protein sleepless n=1 Tax=Xenopsylla cheopis TaxID=163159 RepID=A0A6M2E171_XENCH